MSACGAVDSCSRTDVTLYPAGLRCPEHTPAAVNGRPEPPDPRASAARLPAPRERAPWPYGTTTSDPLGRDGPGWKYRTRNYGIPSQVKVTPT